MDDEIKAIFGDSDKTNDGEEKSIVYSEYIEKINHRAMEDRKKKKAARKEYWSKNHGMGGHEDE